MTNRPWMPLYVADYLADTSHLRALQSGAYLHLIMHYWVTGSLPDDDGQLAAIARLTPEEWAANRPMLQAFFKHGWKHKRVEAELKRCAALSAENRAKAKKAANARWNRKRQDAPSIASSNAWSTPQAMLQNAHSHSQSHLQDDDDDARAKLKPSIGSPSISDTAFKLTNDIARLCGHSEGLFPPSWAGAAMHVQGWLNEGRTAGQIMASCREQIARRRGIAPKSIVYFDAGIAEFVARPPITSAKTEVNHGRKLTAYQQKLADLRALVEQRRRDRGAGQSAGHQPAGS